MVPSLEHATRKFPSFDQLMSATAASNKSLTTNTASSSPYLHKDIAESYPPSAIINL